jgi:hypothetical protein
VRKSDKKVACIERGGHLRKANGKLVGGREDPNLMRREGLWLTNGVRVVKPGCGEYAEIGFSDFPLMGRLEIEQGVKMEEFDRRWKAAMKEWRAMWKKRGGAKP